MKNNFYCYFNNLTGNKEGITVTNIQNGRGYVYFEDLKISLLVKTDSPVFLRKGNKLRVEFLNRDKKNPDSISLTSEQVNKNLKKIGSEKYPFNLRDRLFELLYPNQRLLELEVRIQKLEEIIKQLDKKEKEGENYGEMESRSCTR